MMDRTAAAGALRTVVPAGPAEAEALGRLVTLLQEASDPFGRDHLDPGHVTASAFVLHPDGDRLLLILHGKLGRWLQPGGHVEPRDAGLWEAAAREVAEETGLRAEPLGEGAFDVDVHLVDHGPRPHMHFDVRFLARGIGEPHAGDGVDAIRWVPAAEFEQMEASLRRPARKALGPDGG